MTDIQVAAVMWTNIISGAAVGILLVVSIVAGVVSLRKKNG